MPRAQLPVPSHFPGSVAVMPVQVGARHCVPAAYARQAPLPLHMPSLPQVLAP